MLRLVAPALPVWQRFHEHRFSPDEIAADPVLSRWARSEQFGAVPEGPAHPVGDDRHAAPELDSILEPTSPFVAFAAAMAGVGFSALVTDAEGLILSRRAAADLDRTLASTRLVEGACWDEARRGTNAIGTTIVEGVPVAVLGAAHFERSNHALCCYAAPLIAPSGRLLGVLDATGPAAMAHPALEAAVLGAAATLESTLAARDYAAATSGGLERLRVRLAELADPAFVVERTGRVRLANVAAARLLGAHDRIGGSLAERLGLPELQGGARLAGGMRLEIEPIGSGPSPWAALVRVVGRRGRPRTPPRLPAPTDAFAAVVGSDPAIRHARERAGKFADSDLPVVLLAETGTGKELFARAIHAASRRRDRPFVAINCGALSPSLLESELFGHGPGAFTGARAGGSDGLLAAADGGTLFLDEVAEMAPPAQAALLRFLEDGTYYRVGEHRERRADVRVIAATCRDLPAQVMAGSFRSDLYYRIRGVTIRIAALRERRDLAELCDALLERIATRYGARVVPQLTAAARRAVAERPWPGNVRELRIALEHAFVLAAGSDRIEVEHLPPEEAPIRSSDTRAAAEREALVRALEASDGNLSATARRLGVSRTTLYRMLARHGLRI